MWLLNHKSILFIFQILENEIFKFEEQICDFEEELSNEAIDFPDDVHAEVLAAIGKAKLLMSQKLAQFRGLCEKNIVSTYINLYLPINLNLRRHFNLVQKIFLGIYT